MDKEVKREIIKILETMGFDETTVEKDDGFGDSAWYTIQAQDSSLLIGSGGEHLKALNYIIKRVLTEKGLVDQNITIDVGGYNKKAFEKVRYSAQVSAERAKFLKEDVEMDPMNSYERLIVHTTLQDDSEVETESTGKGASRRVIIKYFGSKKEESF